MQPSSTLLDQTSGMEYFLKTAPFLHLDLTTTTTTTTTTTSSSSTSTTTILPTIDPEEQRRLLQEGYFTADLNVDHLSSRLAQGIAKLRAAGFPASFILMFDEAWELSAKIDSKMGPLTGNTNNGDMLAWDIDPNRNEVGFSPHRDRQPENIALSFHANGMPKYSTAWVALTDATPENSCLYVIPKEFDPGYMTGDLDSIDPLRRCLPNKHGYQNIRALPVPSGTGIFFSHRILHWGSRGRRKYPTPRMALSMACSTNDYEPCYFANPSEQLPFPSYKVRLGLICGQCICYHERLQFTGKEMKLFVEVWNATKHHFSLFYHKKVLKEVIPAVEEALHRDGLNPSAEVGSAGQKDHMKGVVGGTNYSSGSEDDDMLDAALDAMLDGGDDTMDFHDDFDDMGEGVEEMAKRSKDEDSLPTAKRQKK